MLSDLMPDDPGKAFLAGWAWGMLSTLLVVLIWRIYALGRRIDAINESYGLKEGEADDE